MNIEKNIPIPERKKSGFPVSQTLRSMSVGDSILIPKASVISWRSVARSLAIKVCCRQDSETEVRLWRTT